MREEIYANDVNAIKNIAYHEAQNAEWIAKVLDSDPIAESVSLTVCERSMAGCDQRIVVGKRSAKKMTNWA